MLELNSKNALWDYNVVQTSAVLFLTELLDILIISSVMIGSSVKSIVFSMNFKMYTKNLAHKAARTEWVAGAYRILAWVNKLLAKLTRNYEMVSDIISDKLFG